MPFVVRSVKDVSYGFQNISLLFFPSFPTTLPAACFALGNITNIDCTNFAPIYKIYLCIDMLAGLGFYR